MARATNGTVERAAQDYARRGWSVIAVEPRGKRPVVAWQEFQRRIAAPDEIAGWYRRSPERNVAIVTGAVSGLVVLDVDPRHGGAEGLAQLERAHGALPPTLEAETGGGGRHLYFASGEGSVRNKVGLAPGVDVRGEGGCVVAPPSLHASGRRYRWVAGRGPDDVPPAPLPRWLRSPMDGDAGRGRSLPHWRDLARTGVAEGERNATIASFAGHLLWHGVDPDVVRELLLAWNRGRCRPPLPDDEVARTVASIVRLHEREDGAGDAG
jgi:hypothetical protein